MQQFPDVFIGANGAPIGRDEYGVAHNCFDRSIRVFKVRLDAGGYDDGGAYWGKGWAPLYCAFDGHGYRRFTRETSRLKAIDRLEISLDKLKVKPRF